MVNKPHYVSLLLKFETNPKPQPEAQIKNPTATVRVQAACDNTDSPWNRGRAPAEGCGKSTSLGAFNFTSNQTLDLCEREIRQVMAEMLMFCLVSDVEVLEKRQKSG